MLSEALKSARDVAENIARTSGAEIVGIASLNQGNFFIDDESASSSQNHSVPPVSSDYKPIGLYNNIRFVSTVTFFKKITIAFSLDRRSIMLNTFSEGVYFC